MFCDFFFLPFDFCSLETSFFDGWPIIVIFIFIFLRPSVLKAMFGLVESDGIEWNEIESHSIVWICKKGMECDGTHSIQYHSFIQFSIPSNLGCI